MDLIYIIINFDFPWCVVFFSEMEFFMFNKHMRVVRSRRVSASLSRAIIRLMRMTFATQVHPLLCAKELFPARHALTHWCLWQQLTESMG